MIEFPFFNMQQLNLDWIIDKIKGMLSFLPDDGTAGQILRRTADGAEWSDEETVGAVESVNGKTGAVVLDKTDIGLGNVANVAQYSASNPPPYPVTSVNGQTGAVTVQTATDAQVTAAVNTWLGENVAQETGYVLDSTLTMSNAAPPASAVGDLKSAINVLATGEMPVSLGNIVVNSYVETDGTFANYNGWSRTDYIDCEAFDFIRIVSINPASRYNAFYDKNHNFISKFSCYLNDVLAIPSNAKYVAFSNTNAGMGSFECRYLITNANNQWKGKICACLGTSLTANGGWMDVLKERLGFAKMYNRGKGGSTLADYSNDGFQDYVTSISVYDDTSVWGEPVNTCYYDPDNIPAGYEEYAHTVTVSAWYSATTRINTLPSDADLVIVDLATNDYFRLINGLDWDARVNIPQINTPYRQSMNPPTYDPKKFGDAFVQMVQRIMARCPKAKIVVWGMIYNSALCNYNAESGTPSDALDKWKSLADFINNICDTFGITYIDTQHNCGINVFNLTEYCEDGVHPYKPTYATGKGKYAVANVLTKYIENIYPQDYLGR